ncbi:helix-turn-helix domain-containing protein [Hyphomicrobium nitrativorans]|nr:helix-turn-helix domain-containing protein [Hyphomicrobium nitrativorans]
MTGQDRIEDVLFMVCTFYGIERADLLSRARTRTLHRPRLIAMYLSYRTSGASPEEIGMVFDGRDRTIVQMHCRAIARECEEDFDLMRLVQDLERAIKIRWRLT